VKTPCVVIAPWRDTVTGKVLFAAGAEMALAGFVDGLILNVTNDPEARIPADFRLRLGLGLSHGSSEIAWPHPTGSSLLCESGWERIRKCRSSCVWRPAQGTTDEGGDMEIGLLWFDKKE